MTGCIRNLCAAALCAAALLAAPEAAAQQRDLARINKLLVGLQREAGEAGARLQALAGARDAALRARDHVAAARSQVQVAVGDGDPATRLQSAIAARRALESARLAEAPPDRDLADELGREMRRADGALESVEATIRQNRSADRQRAARRHRRPPPGHRRLRAGAVARGPSGVARQRHRRLSALRVGGGQEPERARSGGAKRGPLSRRSCRHYG